MEYTLYTNLFEEVANELYSQFVSHHMASKECVYSVAF